MKKQMLFVCALLSIALSSKAIINVTISSATAPPRVIECTVSEPYWMANNVCCCDINCAVNGNYAGMITNCVRWQAFVLNPPPITPTPYSIDAEISLVGAGPFTQQQQTDYYNFKSNGSYTYARDITHTDEQGNRFTIKAGTYHVINGKLAILASSTTL